MMCARNGLVRYKRQERVIWRKAGFLVARKRARIRHWGARGAPNLLSLVCTMLWSSIASALVFSEKHCSVVLSLKSTVERQHCSELWWAIGSSDWKDMSWLGRETNQGNQLKDLIVEATLPPIRDIELLPKVIATLIDLFSTWLLFAPLPDAFLSLGCYL